MDSREDQPTSPSPYPLPRTRASAEAALPWYRERQVDLYRAYRDAEAAWRRAADDLTIVRQLAAGDYEPDECRCGWSYPRWDYDEFAAGRVLHDARCPLRQAPANEVAA